MLDVYHFVVPVSKYIWSVRGNIISGLFVYFMFRALKRVFIEDFNNFMLCDSWVQMNYTCKKRENYLYWNGLQALSKYCYLEQKNKFWKKLSTFLAVQQLNCQVARCISGGLYIYLDYDSTKY